MRAAYAAHLLLMDLFPRFYSQYDQLWRKQTSGLTADQLAYAKAIAHPAATKWLASRSPCSLSSHTMFSHLLQGPKNLACEF
jgi:hypothetical protein